MSICWVYQITIIPNVNSRTYMLYKMCEYKNKITWEQIYKVFCVKKSKKKMEDMKFNMMNFGNSKIPMCKDL